MDIYHKYSNADRIESCRAITYQALAGSHVLGKDETPGFKIAIQDPFLLPGLKRPKFGSSELLYNVSTYSCTLIIFLPLSSF